MNQSAKKPSVFREVASLLSLSVILGYGFSKGLTWFAGFPTEPTEQHKQSYIKEQQAGKQLSSLLSDTIALNLYANTAQLPQGFNARSHYYIADCRSYAEAVSGANQAGIYPLNWQKFDSCLAERVQITSALKTPEEQIRVINNVTNAGGVVIAMSAFAVFGDLRRKQRKRISEQRPS